MLQIRRVFDYFLAKYSIFLFLPLLSVGPGDINFNIGFTESLNNNIKIRCFSGCQMFLHVPDISKFEDFFLGVWIKLSSCVTDNCKKQ